MNNMENKPNLENTKIIRMYGYEYHLREVYREASLGDYQPCFMGHWNMALTKVVKIDKERLQ